MINSTHSCTCIQLGVVFLCRQYLFDAPPVDPNYERMPEDRPGGFNWGEEDAAE